MSGRKAGEFPQLVVITGPTATGKSTLGVRLAEKINGEIVSADSMQVYKHMDIGTAKPTVDEMCGVPHHLIDFIPPSEDYSVARYVKDASKCLDDILFRGKKPILVGGTGLYIDSLLAGRNFSARADESLRQKLEDEFDSIGGEAMLKKLREVDVESAEKLHANDKKRIIRAFEIHTITGKTISQHDKETKKLPPQYDAIKFALTFSDRAQLYSRIDVRVDEMLKKGLEEEVRSLLKTGTSRKCTSMQAIGYKEISAAVTGETDIKIAVDKVKTESRRYAKRQLTWLRRDNEVSWITWESSPDFDRGVREIMELIHEAK